MGSANNKSKQADIKQQPEIQKPQQQEQVIQQQVVEQPVNPITLDKPVIDSNLNTNRTNPKSIINNNSDNQHSHIQNGKQFATPIKKTTPSGPIPSQSPKIYGQNSTNKKSIFINKNSPNQGEKVTEYNKNPAISYARAIKGSTQQLQFSESQSSSINNSTRGKILSSPDKLKSILRASSKSKDSSPEQGQNVKKKQEFQLKLHKTNENISENHKTEGHQQAPSGNPGSIPLIIEHTPTRNRESLKGSFTLMTKSSGKRTSESQRVSMNSCFNSDQKSNYSAKTDSIQPGQQQKRHPQFFRPLSPAKNSKQTKLNEESLPQIERQKKELRAVSASANTSKQPIKQWIPGLSGNDGITSIEESNDNKTTKQLSLRSSANSRLKSQDDILNESNLNSELLDQFKLRSNQNIKGIERHKKSIESIVSIIERRLGGGVDLLKKKSELSKVLPYLEQQAVPVLYTSSKKKSRSSSQKRNSRVDTAPSLFVQLRESSNQKKQNEDQYSQPQETQQDIADLQKSHPQIDKQQELEGNNTGDVFIDSHDNTNLARSRVLNIRKYKNFTGAGVISQSEVKAIFDSNNNMKRQANKNVDKDNIIAQRINLKSANMLRNSQPNQQIAQQEHQESKEDTKLAKSDLYPLKNRQQRNSSHQERNNLNRSERGKQNSSSLEVRKLTAANFILQYPSQHEKYIQLAMQTYQQTS